MKSPGQISEDFLPVTAKGRAIAPFCDWGVHTMKAEQLDGRHRGEPAIMSLPPPERTTKAAHLDGRSVVTVLWWKQRQDRTSST
jgi:hypothetical protein